MPNRIMRASLLFASCSLFLVSTAVAQEKSAPKLLERTTSSEAAKAALVSAMDEIANIGGGRRIDAKLQAVIAADPNFALGRAYYGAWASTLTAEERQTELTRALKDAANTTTAELLFISALRESRAGRNPVAREILDVVLQLTPDDPDVTFVRLLIAADAADAVRIGEAATKRFPNYAPIYNIYAYRLNDAGRTEEALQAVAKYVALAPTHPNPHDSYAEILQMNGRYDEAETHYGHSLANDPDFEVAHEGMAEVAVLRGNYAAARPHLAQSLAKAATPGRRLAIQRQVAATFLYEGKLKDAKTAMVALVEDGERASVNVLADKRALAVMAALEGNATEAGKLYSAAVPPNPGIFMPVNDAIFHALLKHPAEVQKAVAAMDANAAAAPENADAQQAKFATRVIGAVASNDLNAARTAHAQVKNIAYRALSGAFLAQAANKAGDKTTAQAALADVEAYKGLNVNGGLTRLIAKRK